MHRKLYFIRHIPTGQWYESSHQFFEDFTSAAIFHQRANAEKQLRTEAQIYRGKYSPDMFGAKRFYVTCEEKDFALNQADGSVYRYRDTREELPITENLFSELEVVEFALCECTKDGELL